MASFEICCDRTTLQIYIAPFFKTLLDQETVLLLAVHSSTTVGELTARAKTNSPKEQLRKPLQNFKFQISLFLAHQEVYLVA
jgi:hypothetical protein